MSPSKHNLLKKQGSKESKSEESSRSRKIEKRKPKSETTNFLDSTFRMLEVELEERGRQPSDPLVG